MRLHRPPHDFGRICCRILILLGCAALHAIQHLHLLYFAGTHRWARRDLFNNRVLLLPHPLRDFGRICRRVLSLLGCLAFEQHVHLRFRRMQFRKGQKAVVSRPAQAENSQVRMPFENRTAQTRTATTMEPTIASHSVYGAVSGISFPTDSRIAAPTSTLSLPSPYPATVFVKKN